MSSGLQPRPRPRAGSRAACRWSWSSLAPFEPYDGNRPGTNVTPERLLTLLWSSPERLAAAAPELSAAQRAALYRPPGNPWTRADVALLDEAAELLDDTETAVRKRRRADAERAAADAEHRAYMSEVVDIGLAADRAWPAACPSKAGR